MKTTTLLLLALTAAAGQASASSPDAWKAFDKTLVDSCVAASSLKNAKPAGAPAMFDDSVGYSALLIKGQYKQAFMKNKTGTELCLYDRKNKKALITEWDNVTTLPKK
ncbi:hypothetical protein SAMN03159444_04459 [Pseudomonas sp. NFACC02]|uniref:hypothetical protein n=1 Tax=Pseudomonas sp. NFACC02 TaxID=1566250 RepID=UPI0008BAB09F|nr:hypothetical protein [Pseudomonas sp. NFACC02]SER56519.1 hypothetical protein SAMN03159444_04459 [Pseudomonas sp. NFACC02]